MSRLTRVTSIALGLVLLLSWDTTVHADCNGFGPIQEGNVVWGLKDSVSACPAGDSVLVGHPSRLRIALSYFDSNCNPKVGVPPESIWVTYSGNGAVVNDEGLKIFADDSTNSGGFARITVPSFSGNGSVTVHLYVAGVSQGTHAALVRTTDTNADGRSDGADVNCYLCWSDIDYNGTVNILDQSKITNHSNPKHWHRNTLFGTLVRRSNACSYCRPGAYNTLGGDYCWSPNGRMLAVSIFDTTTSLTTDCTINLIPADPSVGSIPTRFSNPPPLYHDYSPNWSPLGTAIYWVRRDSVIMYKGIYGQNTDTTTYSVAVTGLLNNHTLEDLSISPDGNTLAFHDQSTYGHFRLYTVPAGGGSAFQVTADTLGDDAFPQWSPDGTTLIFHRFVGATRVVYEVPATGGTAKPYAPAGYGHEGSFHPDGGVIVYSQGTDVVHTATVDASLDEGAKAVVNYPEYTTTLPLPRLSPDGTRLAIRSYPPNSPTENMQLWVVRRNMNLPPQLTAFVGQPLSDTTVALPIYVVQGSTFSGAVSASDPELDPLTFGANYVRTDLGMSFDSTARQFSWTPPTSTVGQTFNVKFYVKTASGGWDSFIARFSVHQSAPQFRLRGTGGVDLKVVSANPVRNDFELTGDFHATGVRLDVYDIDGRRVASIVKPSGYQVSWNLRGTHGARVSRGIYFYRVTGGGTTLEGKLVVLE